MSDHTASPVSPKTLKACKAIHKIIGKHNLTVSEYLTTIIALVVTFSNQYKVPMAQLIKILEDTTQ